MMRCICCKQDKPDAKMRQMGTPARPSFRTLCQACLDDPALKYSDCKHGNLDIKEKP